MKMYPVQYSEKLDFDMGKVLDDFSFPWLDRSVPRTEFTAVWNEEVLRFRFEVEDDDIVLDDSEDEHEAALGSDRVELFFASSPDLVKPYYGAEMDPGGRVYDYRATSYRQIDDTWSFESLKFESEIREGGYAVNGSFSLRELSSLGCLDDSKVIAGVYRAEFSHAQGGVDQNWISWIDPGTEVPDFHVPSSFGRFDLVGNPKSVERIA